MTIPDSVRGAPDWLPPASRSFDAVEAAFLDTARLGGYERIHTPVFEHTEVFARGVGEHTDIVSKEMYSFADQGDRSLTLRPEGTAGVMRAVLAAGVPQRVAPPVRYAYAGPFFRRERPQAGRQRQFHQVGVEAFGSDEATVDAEVIWLGWEALRRAGVSDVHLRLNTLGDPPDRARYRELLEDFLDSRARSNGGPSTRRTPLPARSWRRRRRSTRPSVMRRASTTNGCASCSMPRASR